MNLRKAIFSSTFSIHFTSICNIFLHELYVFQQKYTTLTILTAPIETPDPPNETPWGLKTGGFETP